MKIFHHIKIFNLKINKIYSNSKEYFKKLIISMKYYYYDGNPIKLEDIEINNNEIKIDGDLFDKDNYIENTDLTIDNIKKIAIESTKNKINEDINKIKKTYFFIDFNKLNL